MVTVVRDFAFIMILLPSCFALLLLLFFVFSSYGIVLVFTEELFPIHCTCLMTLSLHAAIKLSNHEIMNHNPVIYLIECASCVLVYLCFDGRLCSLIQSAINHLLLPSVNEC